MGCKVTTTNVSGDSGGPLVCQRCDSCNWYVAGVVSFGKGCAQASFYGVYANVVEFEEWIAERAGMTVTKTKTCGGKGVCKAKKKKVCA